MWATANVVPYIHSERLAQPGHCRITHPAASWRPQKYADSTQSEVGARTKLRPSPDLPCTRPWLKLFGSETGVAKTYDVENQLDLFSVSVLARISAVVPAASKPANAQPPIRKHPARRKSKVLFGRGHRLCRASAVDANHAVGRGNHSALHARAGHFFSRSSGL